MVEKANDSSTRFDGDAARWSERGGTPGFAGFHEPVLSRPHDGELRARVMELETELAGLKSDLARMRSIADSALTHAIITLDPEGLVTAWNAGAREITGYGEAEMLGRPADILFTLADRRRGNFAAELAGALEEGRASNERWHLRRDGSRFWASGMMMPLSVPGERPQGFLNIFRDGTAERMANERRELLLAEMNHRIKNSFSVVQAIAATTMRHAPATEEFRPAFAGRLAALASSQDVLIRGNWNDAPLAGAIEAVLDGFGESGRITLDGPAVTLFADTVVTVSMAFHELATNAVKHGALSAPGGRVQVTWTTSRTPPSIVEILWRERGGPMVTPPSRRGFGSQLLEQGMPRGGTVKLDYRPEGLECRICLPLGRGSRQNGH